MPKIGRDGRVPKRGLGAVPIHNGMYFKSRDGSGLVRGISPTQHAAMQSGGIPVNGSMAEKEFYRVGGNVPTHPSHAGPRRHGVATHDATEGNRVLNDAALRIQPRRKR
jgi:hypothetical protein